MSENRTPLVSIVLPTYNRCNKLPRAIESCLQQTYENIELIVVDDGSSDNTKAVVENFCTKDARVKYVGKKNAGLPRALNTGFEASSGAFLTWTSDDNEYLPEAIETMLASALTHTHTALIYSDYWTVTEDANGNESERKHVGFGEHGNLAQQNIVGACFLYSREIYNTVGQYDPDYALVEDYEYWVRISKQFDLVNISEPLYLYSFHPESLTSLRTREIKALAYVVRLKYGLISGGECFKLWRKNLRHALKENAGQRLEIFSRIFSRSVKLLLKATPAASRANQ